MKQISARSLLGIFLLLPPGVPAQTAQPADARLRLSLAQAVTIALGPDGSARARIAEELISQARARSTQSRAALLPNIDAYVSEQSATRNLQAFGLRLQSPIPGFSIPTFVGPFNIFDARATATQTVFDMSSIRRYQASRAGVGQAEAENENTADQVRDQVARAYLTAVRTDAVVEAVKADVQLAEALLKQAEDQKTAGTGTGIEVTRSRVQLANERQRLLSSQNDRTRAYLQLLRAIGVDMSTPLELTEALSFPPVQTATAQDSVRRALELRPDWKAQQKREEAARLNQSATTLERLPSLGFFGDYGTIGTGLDNTLPTRTYGISLRIPVFDGGRRDARRSETASVTRQEQLRTRDLRAQIEMEIRLALEALGSNTEQVRTAEEGLKLAEDEVAHARRRYESGVGSSIEVTDAQTRLERARENRILALYGYNLARIDLHTAMGSIRDITQ